MAIKFTPKYGFTAEEVCAIYERWKRLDGRENFGSFDGFCKWMSEVGCERGMHMRKHDATKPHSPQNSFFYPKYYMKNKKREKIQATRAITCSFCESCTEKACPNNGIGCRPWREWFTENWNNNIHRKKPVAESNVPMVFCYEHPDLVREGIVWAGN